MDHYKFGYPGRIVPKIDASRSEWVSEWEEFNDVPRIFHSSTSVSSSKVVTHQVLLLTRKGGETKMGGRWRPPTVYKKTWK